MNFILKYYKHPIAIVLYVAIGIVIIYFIGKYAGSFINKPNELPKDKDWGTALTTEESQKVRRIVSELFDDMDSYLVSIGARARNEQVYLDLINCNDKLFTAVYNDFNDLHLKDEKGTLKTWINDEYGIDGTSKNLLMNRFNNLNLA